MNPIEQIKERIDIVSFISDYVGLRKAGRNWLGFCPFHANTRTPAFTVFPDSNSYHCFGCKASGTVFDFLMQREGLSFAEALEQLAQRAGIQLQPRTQRDEQEDAQRSRIYDINQATARWWTSVLLQSPKAASVREYVEKRGISRAMIETFQLGYAPDEWSGLLSYLNDRMNATPQELSDAGLALERETGGFYDRFRGRLMFPIQDAKGRIVGFGGRILGDGHPKYMNSPQTLVFDKSSILYGLHQAREAIRASNSVVVVEGYVDVMMAHQHGFKNVVAPMGTALTDVHAAMLNKLTKNIILAMDGDSAGQTAALRGLETLRENLDTVRPVPTASGMLRWEHELDANIKLVILPEGRDPDDLIRSNPQNWQNLIAHATPLMDFYLHALTKDLDLASAKGKATAVERLAPILGSVGNPIERAHYSQKIAALVRIDERIIADALRLNQPDSRKPTKQPMPAAIASQMEREAQREDYLLSLLLRFPQIQPVIAEKLRDDMTISPALRDLWNGDIQELFDRTENRVLWRLWREQGHNGPPDPLKWAEQLPLGLNSHCLTLLQWSDNPPLRPYRVAKEAEECLRPLRQRLARRWNDQIGQLLSAAEPEEQERYQEQAMALMTYLRATTEPKRSTYFQDSRDSLKY
ncbi:MAG: DNA primase [Herpetosiphon sp.]|nr:DNA primase [Herpetosiphon sp.]